MNGRRSEVRHHTDEQIIEVLREAHAAVMKANIPEKFHVAAFTKACELRAAKNITIEQVVPGGLLVPPGAEGH